MAAGCPLGAVGGGIIATHLLASSGWRSVFAFGAYATAACIPLVWWLLPESVSYLVQRQPRRALERVNQTLRRMGHRVVEALPTSDAASRRVGSWLRLFEPGLARTTTLLTLAYFAHIMTFYFLLKWIPKIVVDMGFPQSSAAGVLVWTNVGGATGGAVFGLLTLRFGLKPLTIVLLMLSTVTVTLFGRSPADLQRLAMICAMAGFCTNAGIVGLYAIIARVFPTQVRAFGTGFTVGVGRGGSVLAPIIAGFLFTAGYSLPTVSMTMATGSLLAAAVLILLKLGDRPAVPGQDRPLRTTHLPEPRPAR
jgi:MFS family permease